MQVPADQIGGRRRAAAIRHVDQFHAGHHLKSSHAMFCGVPGPAEP